MNSKPFGLIFVRSHLLVSLLCVFCGLCVNISAQEFKILKPGIEYAEVTKEISGKSVNMNLLRLDLTKVRIDVHHAMDMAIGTEKTSSIATRHGAFAAINAGFFRLDTSIWAGDSDGILMIDGKVISVAEKPRTALYLLNDRTETRTFIKEPQMSSRLAFGSSLAELIQIDFRQNCERGKDDLIVYTPEFGVTTLTNPDGLEIIVKKDRIVEVLDATGSNVIPRDGFVISATGSERKRLLSMAKLVSKKKRVGQLFSFELAQIDSLDDIVGGVPQLIKNSKINITWEQEKSTKSFVETRHPRTAVAKLKDGKFLMITVDGRSESSGGIGLQDLAEFLLSIGATDAMNLDGGGSTTMFVDGKVVNKPSDKEGERKVSDAILVTLRTGKK